jgi:hypothetical protein
MRKYISLILIGFVTGCVTAGVERIEQLEPATKVVLLSLMGDKLAMHYAGTTIFQYASRDIDVTTWQIDKHTESVAVRLLHDGGKVTVTSTDTERARKMAGALTGDLWTGAPKLQGGTESVTNLAKEAGADFVLVVGPSLHGDPFFETMLPIGGYGIYQRSILFYDRAINYVTMRTVLFDGRNGEEVARTRCYLSAPRSDSDWMERGNLNLTQADEPRTRSSIEQLIERGLRECFLRLKLVP